jgi:aspartate/tyrosine/aromatic aminotransferase
VRRSRPDATVWTSDPTWANHVPLLGGAGLNLDAYPYYHRDQHRIRIAAMLKTLDEAAAGDLVLLHGCCHNPCGLDLSAEWWQAVAEVMERRGLVPFIDMAYQGFAQSLDDDAFIVRHLAARVPEMLVANSCSKNFGLYRDRVGSLSYLTADERARNIVHSQVNNVVRTIYSVPPDHGAVVVATILGDAELKAAWRVELAEMRGRLREMRVLLNDALREKAPTHDFSHLVRARGMFCFLGISEAQVKRLKKDYGVYMVGSSRINTAGITAHNVNYLADAIAATL